MSSTLYYRPGSPFAWKVCLALEHKAVPYEFRPMHAQDENGTATVGAVPLCSDNIAPRRDHSSSLRSAQTQWLIRMPLSRPSGTVQEIRTQPSPDGTSLLNSSLSNSEDCQNGTRLRTLESKYPCD
jgi:hypothetical protein